MVETMTNEDLIKYYEKLISTAIAFEISPDVVVEKRGNDTWCVKIFGSTVLDKNLQRHHEPMPSNRSDEFISKTRFTLDTAIDLAYKWIEKEL